MKNGRKPVAAGSGNAADACLEGRIIKGVGGFYEVWIPGDGRHVTCKARGVFRRSGQTPLAGDRVLVRLDSRDPAQGVLAELRPRQSEFVRPPVANMDCMAIVVSAVTPAPDLPLVDKLLIACELRGIRPLLVVNKMDLLPAGIPETDVEAPLKEGHAAGDSDAGSASVWQLLRTMYAATGYEMFPVSCVTGEGIPALLDALAGCTTVLAGQSGVGKSTLLNAMLDAEHMETGSLSEKIGRGRHTTRHAELLPLPGDGWMCDTPGFSRYELDPVSYDTLDAYFPEFEPERRQCRFPGCSHLHEPDCAVARKLTDGGISPERHARYAQFYEELRERHQNRFRRQGGAST